MFSIDFPEIVIIFGVALVVLGPKKLPGAAAQIGRWVGRARAMARQFREQLEQEVNNVESSLDLNKADPARTKESSAGAASAEPASAGTASSASAGATAADAAPPGGAAEAGSATHTSVDQHAATGDSPGEAPVDLYTHSDPGETHAGETNSPRLETWPASAGGWSPESLIAASMPSSESDESDEIAAVDWPDRPDGPAAKAEPADAEPANAGPANAGPAKADHAKAEPAAVEHAR